MRSVEEKAQGEKGENVVKQRSIMIHSKWGGLERKENVITPLDHSLFWEAGSEEQ